MAQRTDMPISLNILRVLKGIPGFQGYFAANDGTIWSERCGELVLLKPTPTKKGYLRVSLSRDGKSYTRFVHALILLTFVGPKPTGMEACHYPDEDKRNNRPSNLRWDTPAENAKDKYRDRPNIAEKRCNNCGNTKPKAEFYRDSRASDGLKGDCKPCHSKQAMETRDYDRQRARNRDYMRRKSIERRA